MVPGGECLYGVGLELVVSAERGIEAIEARGFRRGYRVDQFLRDARCEAYQNESVGNGMDRMAGQEYDLRFFRWGKSGFDENLEEEVFLGGVRIDVLHVPFEFDRDLLRRGIGGKLQPASEV